MSNMLQLYTSVEQHMPVKYLVLKPLKVKTFPQHSSGQNPGFTHLQKENKLSIQA